MDKGRIALQLYTVRDAASHDFLGTLRKVAEMGYPAVEFAGYGGVPADEVRSVLDETGMRGISAHVGLQQLEEDSEEVFNILRTLGCEYVFVPWVAEEYRNSMDAVQQLAVRLNRLGLACQAQGLEFGYHNHAFEFERLGGSTILDLLMQSTDPDLVKLQLDLGWAISAGVDVVALLSKYSGRVPTVHMKDWERDDPKQDAPVGTGSVDWPPILEACEQAGVLWYIVEQDHPKQPMQDAETSLRNLRQALSDQ